MRRHLTAARALPIAGLLLAIAAPGVLCAADAHRAVQPKPGEIVLLRNVPTRPAVRQAPPDTALIVDTKPNSQLAPALAGMELSDLEAGAVSAPIRSATSLLNGALATRTGLAAPQTATGQAAPRGAAATTTPLSAVGNATRGVGSQITGALQALPFGGKGPGG